MRRSKPLDIILIKPLINKFVRWQSRFSHAQLIAADNVLQRHINTSTIKVALDSLDITRSETPHRETVLAKILEGFLTARPQFQARVAFDALLSLLVGGEFAWLGDAAEAEGAVEEASQDVFVGFVASGD
jgi:hypothetical protein